MRPLCILALYVAGYGLFVYVLFLVLKRIKAPYVQYPDEDDNFDLDLN